MSFRQVSLQSSSIHKSIGKQLKLDFEAVTDSKRLANGKISLIAKANEVPVRVMGFGEDLLPSQKFQATGVLLNSKEPRVAALFISWRKFRLLGKPDRLQERFGEIRSDLRAVSKSSPLIPGMVLGDTSLQSAEFSDAMRRSGLTHLTAVSGANFAIVSAFVLWLVQFPIRSIRIRMLVTAAILILFIGLVRPSPSVLRAAAMAAVVIVAKSHKEQSDSLPALGFAISIVVLADPWQARDPGFALSVLATAGLLLIAPKLKFPKIVAEPIAASLLCAPVIVWLSGYLSISAIFANILAAPLVAPITILGFISALVPPLAPFLIAIAKLPADLITRIAFTAAEVPVIEFKSALLVIAFAAGFFFLFQSIKTFERKLGKLLWLIVFIIIFLLTYGQRWPNNNWQIANCDVGQGDALVLKVAANSAILMDVGPEPKKIDRCLKTLGITNIPLVVLTHPHEDHVGGLTGALLDRKVGQVLSTAKRGDLIEVGALKIKILWPDGVSHNFADNGGEGSEINNESIVALVDAPDYSMLVTGDIEPDAQKMIVELMPTFATGRAHEKLQLLKVAHHGSKYQDLRFNALANPDIAIISVGAGNKYGHPAESTLKLFRKVVRTDLSGAIAIDPKAASISASKVGILGLPVLWRIA